MGAVSTSSGIWTGLGTTVGSMAFGNYSLMMRAGATYKANGRFAGRTAFNTMAGAAGGVILAKDAPCQDLKGVWLVCASYKTRHTKGRKRALLERS